jgi:transposase
MIKSRRKHSAEFKTKVVLEMLGGTQTLSEIASKHGIHPTQLTNWKKTFLEKASEIFSDSNSINNKAKVQESLEGDLYKKIGQLQIELDWLKKKPGLLM